MSEFSPVDPYSSPALPEGPYAGKPGSGRPQLLTVLIIVCLVLGALGIFNSITGAVGAAAGPQLQKALQPKMPPNVPPGMQKAQDDFQAEINEVQAKYFWEMVISLGVRLLAAVLLVVGSVKALGRKESGRVLLIAACAVALAFEMGHAILQTIMNTEVMTALNGYLESMSQSMPNKDKTKQVQSLIQGVGGVVKYLTIGGIYLLLFIKGGIYLFGLIYLRREKVKEYFQP
jgi:hypothetical protein